MPFNSILSAPAIFAVGFCFVVSSATAFAAPLTGGNVGKKKALESDRRGVPMIPIVAYATPTIWTKAGYIELDLGQMSVSNDGSVTLFNVQNFGAGIPVAESVQAVVSSSMYQADLDQKTGFEGTIHNVSGSFGFAWRVNKNWYVGIAGRHQGSSLSGKVEITQSQTIPISIDRSKVAPEFGLHFRNRDWQVTFGHENLSSGDGSRQHVRSRWWMNTDFYLCAGGDYENSSDDDSKQENSGAVVGLGYSNSTLNSEVSYEVSDGKEREKSGSQTTEQTESSELQLKTRYRIDPKSSIGLQLAVSHGNTKTTSDGSDATKSTTKGQEVSLVWGIKI